MVAGPGKGGAAARGDEAALEVTPGGEERQLRCWERERGAAALEEGERSGERREVGERKRLSGGGWERERSL